MASTEERTIIAAALWEARRACTTIAPPSANVAHFDLDDGYAVGAELYARRVAEGERRAGVKIGFTNTAVWTALGLEEPICAPVYDSTLRYAVDSLGEIVIDTTRLVAPKIEPEIVVGIGPDGLLWWALGFEIVHCHYPEWKVTPAEALADSGLHGALIVGVPVPLSSGSQTLRSPFEVELYRDGVLYESGSTASVLGGPLIALDKAMEVCARENVLEPPRTGDVVTTGTITAAPRIAPGETWSVRSHNGAPPLEIVVR